MYKIAISRPILTLVFALLLIFFGVLALFKFPVALYPDIDFPTVTITTKYPGANAETIETKVTDKIEEAISGIDGIDKITSYSSQNYSFITVQFVLEKDKYEATSDVRDKVGSVSFDDSNIENPIIEKFDTSSAPIISVFVSSDKVPIPKLMADADRIIKPKLETISGVGGTNAVGYRERAVRIQPNASLMNKYGITFSQLSDIIAQENLEIDGGKIKTHEKEWIITIDSNAKSVEELKNIRVSNNLLLGDIATIEDSVNEDTTYASMNGVTGVIYEVQKIAGRNDIEIADGVIAALPELREHLPDYNIEIFNDTTEYIRDSIADVKFDLVLGAILATTIVFLFLRSFTMTIVAAISLPISIMGTFAFVQAMGQSLNMLTMLALTLSIGIIIDDAIVVIENIHKKLESGMSRLEAAYEGVKEIGFAIIAISSMLLAVFVPIASMGEIVGKFLKAFALAAVAAIIISYFVVVTVIPMVSSLIVSTKVSKFYTMTAPIFKKLDEMYIATVKFAIRFKFSTLIAIILFFALSLMLVSRLGFNFMVSEDRSQFAVIIETAPGTTLEYMTEQMQIAQEIITSDKDVTLTNLQVGFNTLQDPYKAKFYVALVPQKERKNRSQFQIMADMRTKIRAALPDMNVNTSEISLIGGGSNSPLQVIILGEQEAINTSSNNLVALLKNTKGIIGTRTDTSDDKPQFKIRVLRQNANKNNVSTQAIGNAINAAFSGETQVAYYRENQREYDILLRVPDSERDKISNLQYLQIPNDNGEMIFLSGLIDIEETATFANIKRFNRERSVTVYGDIDQKQTTINDILQEIENKKSEWMVPGISYKLSGEAEYAQKTLREIGIAVLTAFVLIYLILAALYESLVQPIIIMITLPLSFSGAFMGLYFTGNSLSMFGLIGLMVLMGVVGKNATLIVDVANEIRKTGKSIDESIVEAGGLRLRPILMTAFAMVFGMIPLAISTGAGSSMKYPVGFAMIGGLVVSLFLSLLVVPAFYKIMSPIDEWLRKFYSKNLKFE